MKTLKYFIIITLGLINIACGDGGDPRITEFLDAQEKVLKVQQSWIDEKLEQGKTSLNMEEMMDWVTVSAKAQSEIKVYKEGYQALLEEGIKPSETQRKRALDINQQAFKMLQAYQKLTSGGMNQ